MTGLEARKAELTEVLNNPAARQRAATALRALISKTPLSAKPISISLHLMGRCMVQAALYFSIREWRRIGQLSGAIPPQSDEWRFGGSICERRYESMTGKA